MTSSLSFWVARAAEPRSREGKGRADLISAFASAASESLLQEAKAEIARTRGISPQRCFATAQARTFLEAAVSAAEELR